MNNGYYVLLACAVLSMGCKKETATSQEWRELAERKLHEIEALVATIPCSQASDAVIEPVAQYCGETYYPVTPSIKSKFDKLRDSYEQFSRREWDLFVDEGGVIDCFGPSPQPIRMGCEDDKLLVYTVQNLPIEEAREMAEDLHARIRHYKDTISCSGAQQWGLEIVQDLVSAELEVLPVRYGDHVQDWRYTIADYQVLVRRLWQAAGNKTYPRQAQQPTGAVACEDGKPVIEYEEE